MITRNNISIWILVAICVPIGVYRGAHALTSYNSYTPKHETDLAQQWDAFNKQQAIVDRAKETQQIIKKGIVSTTVDLSESKRLDEANDENPNRDKMSWLAEKAHCYFQIIHLNVIDEHNPKLEEICTDYQEYQEESLEALDPKEEARILREWSHCDENYDTKCQLQAFENMKRYEEGLVMEQVSQ